jgi:hypothetical protein
VGPSEARRLRRRGKYELKIENESAGIEGTEQNGVMAIGKDDMNSPN